ncbi:MAG: hypothetical protein AB4062_13495 [Crocosphaera sp.]
MTTTINTRVNAVYKLAKNYPENKQLQEAVEVVKTLRRSQGQLVRRREEQKIEKKSLKAEIVKISKENQELKVEINLKYESIEALKSELTDLNQQMVKLTQDKQTITAQRDKVIAELKNIETEVELATIKVKETKSLYGKFSIVWMLIQSLFFSDNPQDFGKIDNTLPYDPNKPQMGTSQSDIGRHSLDK